MPVVALSVILMLSTLGFAGRQPQVEPDRVPVLAELFTSEGRNSCPPADQLLEQLSKEQPIAGVYVVALSEHVTYWDHQGWKDAFGSPRFTERQNMYGFRFHLDGVFTPQLVIDAAAQAVGSDWAGLRVAIAQAAQAPNPRLTVELSLTDKGLTASASGPGLAAGAREGAELLWAVTEDDLAVDVKRGENAKRTLRHSNVVRSLSAMKIDSTKAARLTSGVIPPSIRMETRTPSRGGIYPVGKNHTCHQHRVGAATPPRHSVTSGTA
jgi:hypothetical protein